MQVVGHADSEWVMQIERHCSDMKGVSNRAFNGVDNAAVCLYMLNTKLSCVAMAKGAVVDEAAMVATAATSSLQRLW